ncbi:MAG TPA: phosphatidylserine decarboxylase family protein [Syntrophales bacterium]|nr:phosphatidylserine decarboxylase family protein [Syntrophales bacterium]HNS53495.1 phosphatidylserine decarboxylase family protein [Syntrophales bacterium]
MDRHDGYIVREGVPFIVGLGLLSVALSWIGLKGLAAVACAAMLFVLFFFRNPRRTIPEGPGLVVSPADGRVLKIEEVQLDGPLTGGHRKVSIFMNVFNVHVNRIPHAGRVEKIEYHAGKFLSADLDKASADNERNTVLIRTAEGKAFLTIQIAGLIARRIVCWIGEGMEVARGQRFGLICFGSRLEVILPLDSKVLVQPGQKVRAGETPLGVL